ncbi:transposase [Rhodococcus sp. D-1]|uniref:transposase n=1 Tax=Rhodococcus sp. D-1 TaxID=1912238 RepID=UPI00117B1B84|nr:transposase [Rhodococcus sp. D-1]
MPKRYPEEFRRKVLDLVAAGRPIAEIAHDLQVSDQTIYGWRKQDLIDTGRYQDSHASNNPSSPRRKDVSVNSRTKSQY